MSETGVVDMAVYGEGQRAIEQLAALRTAVRELRAEFDFASKTTECAVAHHQDLVREGLRWCVERIDEELMESHGIKE